ncbi:aminotransferase class I/II-fold pyridoxal phosphate-dependent enzyme [Paraliobacillus zengyii]|uniref:aminotransferase class I/II-fold pyridoxal phosphate-dependent enzyme n=1 Tax=Paraliobacillus zengyii TaxID=2213194 RepID=UPI000DD49538|nr:aminotransferase class I/II-fold pyridoxal phosphate-dependent enzyme [Paraliobacillus zengyii]
MKNQLNTPLFNVLKKFADKEPLSLHVPGHKNGTIFPDKALDYYSSILSIDLTELTGLDDLHAPNEAIAEAESMASEWFNAAHTFFLVGGSTVGNLAMILATCAQNEKVIVQRNSHKSIFNGIELSGAWPIFVAPTYDENVRRYTAPSTKDLIAAIVNNPDAKVLVLTYPDYFGHTYELDEIIEIAHKHQITVLVDEAHGVHFSVDKEMFPKSALDMGADIVVQSAHKMAPAMTMAAFLHVNVSFLKKERIAHYLQILQSSSPSYPLMASLDLARSFLATRTKEDIVSIKSSIRKMRYIFSKSDVWDLIPIKNSVDDPLKIVLHVKQGYTTKSIATIFESEGIFAELRTDSQLLFIHGFQAFNQWERLERAVEKVTSRLIFSAKHDTIETKHNLFPEVITTLAYSYLEMPNKETEFIEWASSVGKVTAEAVIPYPPGIPVLVRGEKITEEHLETIDYLLEKQTNFQHLNIRKGVTVFKGE